MPTVKTYRKQIDTQAAPSVQRRGYAIPQLETPLIRAVPSAESYGAGFFNAVGQIGEAIYADEIAKQDAVRLQQADRQLSDWELDRIYNPEHGALTVKGQSAYG